MEIQLKLNGRPVRDSIDADTLLIDFVRAHGCASVKRGCETSNCGLCTVLLDGKPVLSCSVLAARADGHEVQTLEGLQAEAEAFVGFIADQGAEQCGFCNPGYVMNTIALLRENPRPHRRRDPRLSCGQSLPLLGVRGTAAGHPGISECPQPGKGGELRWPN